MKEYTIQCPVTNASGTQCWTVKARSEKEAIKKFHQGKHEFLCEEVEVMELGEPEVIEVKELP